MADSELDASNAQDDGGSSSLGDILEGAYNTVEASNPSPEEPVDGTNDAAGNIDEGGNAGADNTPNEPNQPDPNAAPIEPDQPAVEDTPANPDVNDVAPDRFVDAAKGEWANVPPSVKAEINRAVSELETGIEGYRQKLAPYEGLEQFAQMAADGKTTLAQAMQHYHGMENMLCQDPIAGLTRIAANLGLNFNQIAAQHLNVNPNQQAVQYENVINGLRNQVGSLESQLKGIDKRFSEQDQNALNSQIDTFKDGKEHFEAVRADMGALIQIGKAQDLQSAYDLAVKMNGLTNTPSKGANTMKDNAKAVQTQKGSLSISGAPDKASKAASGKGKLKSTRAALADAFAATT